MISHEPRFTGAKTQDPRPDQRTNLPRRTAHLADPSHLSKSRVPKPDAMSSSEAPVNVRYEANCHCGAVRYAVHMPPLETLKVTNCNCSVCCKNGYLNVYPKRADVVFRSGEDHMQQYLFGEKKCAHKFCPTCGSSLFVDPHADDAELIVVNVCRSFAGCCCLRWTTLIGAKVRMFKDVDVDRLELYKYDGFNKLQPRYEV